MTVLCIPDIVSCTIFTFPYLRKSLDMGFMKDITFLASILIFLFRKQKRYYHFFILILRKLGIEKDKLSIGEIHRTKARRTTYTIFQKIAFFTSGTVLASNKLRIIRAIYAIEATITQITKRTIHTIRTMVDPIAIGTILIKATLKEHKAIFIICTGLSIFTIFTFSLEQCWSRHLSNHLPKLLKKTS